MPSFALSKELKSTLALCPVQRLGLKRTAAEIRNRFDPAYDYFALATTSLPYVIFPVMRTSAKPMHLSFLFVCSRWFKEFRWNLACVAIVSALGFVSTQSAARETPVVQECCGDENFVYHPSKDRIKITNSAAVAAQIASSRNNADESARLTKAIKVGNFVLQARINGDLFRIGHEQDPPEIREGWQKYYAPYVAVAAPELKRILETPLSDRRVSQNLAPGGMTCPHARLTKVEALPTKTLVTYQFVHIARSAGMFKGIRIVDHPLELVENGKIGTYSIALNRDVKYVPNDPDTEWWTAFTTKAFKESLNRHIKSHYGPDQQYKPKLRELLTQITDAEKVCQQKNLFDR